MAINLSTVGIAVNTIVVTMMLVLFVEAVYRAANNAKRAGELKWKDSHTAADSRRRGSGAVQEEGKMSKIVTTKLGRFRAVTDGASQWWLWECVRCRQEWLPLTVAQMNGEASVLHDYYYGEAAYGSQRYCGYHETHEFGKELAVTIQTKAFFGEQPFAEDLAAA